MLKIRGKTICKKIVVCSNIFSQGLGLMLRSKDSVKGTAWIFEFSKPRKIAITMAFVFFPIDLAYVDGKGKIVELKRNLKPFQYYYPKSKAVACIELKAGAIRDFRIQLGQHARWYPR